MDPRVMSQDGIDVDRVLPASEAGTSGFSIGDTDPGHQTTGEFPWLLRMGSILIRIYLFLSLSARGTSYIGGDPEQTEASKGLFRCDNVVGSRSCCTSREEKRYGHTAPGRTG